METKSLTHFHLPINYETGTKLLNSLKKYNSTHISDHIHEWRHRRRLVKTYISDQLLEEWFFKSLLPDINEDVSKGGVITKDKFIIVIII